MRLNELITVIPNIYSNKYSLGEKQLSTFTIISNSLPESYEILPSIILRLAKHCQCSQTWSNPDGSFHNACVRQSL